MSGKWHGWRVAVILGVVATILTTTGAISLVARAAETEWSRLSARPLPEVFAKAGKWYATDQVALVSTNPRRLQGKPGDAGQPILVNGDQGRVADLITREQFQDVELRCEFLVAKGSNSGVKFNGQYEIQIRDTASEKKLTGDSCGGIYPRAEQKPKYHHIDEGVAPKANVAKPAGEWQSLHVIFQSPRFDAAGKKIANAKFVKVVLNGETIHENVEVAHPTGHAWVNPEKPKGPLLFQGDHGPVAFRAIEVRAWTAPKANE
ncbi:3-keto-disaccharide hydrolase [Tuwongella immobilis]|uniref:3-keto-alpha-glucoside-1,2-lyase/3-keto-2-hydroxy-glucal hydratase domain-containing protein n=1 Tax=Tuwongella immobilis TaxID=692036 RepID=A0A6C2YRU8_9BACT|nr:DUF1080 domain-containing protein [Tuwongella immobilis]VIP04077.1 Uncharacterized protein OS=Singulisphaera acidiphila (strain ATCC BAA-1392 / DSM 18658 / VKM B-2454 / MOB10) GN=Sinac_5626 PE=4 SV=1: DUF1080 [Tuwongella immobilis]VTS05521.1 Uncharacterized protein OS=Singulisphaera acidiphila (strain ATCC BAA-1392 / DSM 18658 / VKM B-2454 / MOB10) GN=Sinac_5626 PE=4 SV=1: DUF1080 [Tuwongella immobilis]